MILSDILRKRGIKSRRSLLVGGGTLAVAALMFGVSAGVSYYKGQSLLYADENSFFSQDVRHELEAQMAQAGEGMLFNPDATLFQPSPSPQPSANTSSFSWNPFQRVASFFGWGNTGSTQYLEETSLTGQNTYSSLTDVTLSDNESVGQGLNSDFMSSDLVGRVRVVKTGWHWNWPEYGGDKPASVTGLTPELLPSYSLKVMNPTKYAVGDPNYNNFIELYSHVPSISGADIGVLCPQAQLPVLEKTTSGGYANYSVESLSLAGCSSEVLNSGTAKVSLMNYGTPKRGSALYDYYVEPDQREQALLPVSKEDNFAKTVFIAYRPTIAGRALYKEGNSLKPIVGAKLCIFYREPEDNEPCAKPGLSVPTTADEDGYYLTYASWGDYATKGAGQTVYLMIDTQRGRFACAKPFSILGDDATEQDCILDNQTLSQGLTDSEAETSAPTTKNPVSTRPRVRISRSTRPPVRHSYKQKSQQVKVPRVATQKASTGMSSYGGGFSYESSRDLPVSNSSSTPSEDRGFFGRLYDSVMGKKSPSVVVSLNSRVSKAPTMVAMPSNSAALTECKNYTNKLAQAQQVYNKYSRELASAKASRNKVTNEQLRKQYDSIIANNTKSLASYYKTYIAVYSQKKQYWCDIAQRGQ